MNNPDFQNLLNQFNEYALRPVLANAKEKLDQSVNAIPTTLIAQSVADAYAQITNVDVEGTLNKALDPDKVTKAVNNLKTELQDPQSSLQFAQALKQLLNETSSEKFAASIMKATQNASQEQQFAAQILAAQLGPKIDELKIASVAEVAEQIRDFGKNLSAADINMQLDLLKQMAPQAVAQQQQELLSQLPAPEAVADAVKNVGNAASKALGDASKGATFAETIGILKQFPENAASIFRTLGQNVSNDQPPVVKPPKKGKGYKI